jgi:hypothetical protein
MAYIILGNSKYVATRFQQADSGTVSSVIDENSMVVRAWHYLIIRRQ